MTADRWPALPKTLPGVGGVIRVQRPPAGDDRLPADWMGCWSSGDRTIMVRRALRRDVAWATLIHEWTHAALDDCGVHLRPRDEETVCQAIAAAGRLLIPRSLRRTPQPLPCPRRR